MREGARGGGQGVMRRAHVVRVAVGRRGGRVRRAARRVRRGFVEFHGVLAVIAVLAAVVHVCRDARGGAAIATVPASRKRDNRKGM